MVVRERLDLLVCENSPEFAAPGLWKIRVRAATRGKNKPAVAEVFPEIGHFGFGEDEAIVPVHEHERRLKQFRIGELKAALLLELEGRSAGHQAHQFLANVRAIVAVVGTVFNPAHEEGRVLVAGSLWAGRAGAP